MMPHILAQAVMGLTTVLAVAGIGYFLAAMLAAQSFERARREPTPAFAPGVSILKSLRGLDPGMLDAFRSHCRQKYTGEYELLFGVSSMDDPSVEAVRALMAEFPQRSIKLIECPRRLGTNGKVSTLVQLVQHAQHDYLLINDSDITVGPRYLAGVMAHFSPSALGSARHQHVGMVTALYRGRAHGTLPSMLEALGMSTDFLAGVLLSRMLTGGLGYGLGSTLAVSREALTRSGGLEPLVDCLADDNELGVRIHGAGYRIAVCGEVVETSVPAYDWRAFFDHQVRWARTVRDATPWGYFGLIFTHGLCWAVLNVLASGAGLLSLWILSMSFFLRIALAMMVGAIVLGDRQVLPRLWLLPFRDAINMGIWIAGFAGHSIVWRGERFLLRNGILHRE